MIRQRVKLIPFFIFFLFLTSLYADKPTCNEKQLIGGIVKVALPQIGVENIRAKIDTGAYSSSIDCSKISVDSINKSVTFTPLNLTKSINMPLSRVAFVKSSNGIAQERAFVVLKVSINGCFYHTEFSLTNRSDMRYPILIGRQLIKDNFIIDLSLRE